ncbi:MAG TPA: hypothetical protein VLS93_10960 [Anaeromyxobacteraceae bacterium]|nr:hypothetical protein [Anaeromyxobacteraceae bacterium]
MNALALALAAVLSSTPFPPPRLAPASDRMKCDTGTVFAVDTARSELRVTTPAGMVTFKAGSDVQVVDRDGKPFGPVSKLAAGQAVRVYYLVEQGAKALEVALE